MTIHKSNVINATNHIHIFKYEDYVLRIQQHSVHTLNKTFLYYYSINETNLYLKMMKKNPCRFPYALCPPEVNSKMLCAVYEMYCMTTAVTE